MAALPERSFLRRLFVTMLMVVAVVVLWRGTTVFLLLFLAGLLAVVLHAASAPLRDRTRLSESAAVAVTAFVLVALLILAGWLFAPRLTEQANEFVQAFPELLTEVRDLAQQVPLLGDYLEQFLPDNAQTPEQDSNGSAEANNNESSNQDGASLNDAVGPAFEAVASLFKFAIYVLFVVFAALFLAMTPGLYKGGLLQLVPRERTQRAEEVIDITVLTLRHWLLGQLAVMAIVGVLSAFGLWALGVPLALLLGFIAGILEFISLLGPIIAAVPAILVALSVSPTTAVYVALLYFAIQQLESYVITPLVQKRAVHLPPVLTITIVVLMHALFGLVGAFVAVPAAVVLRTLVKMLYVQDELGKEIELEAATNGG